MSHRVRASIGALAVVSLAATAQAQSPAAPTADWTLPRTPDGRPDLQGVWSFATLTPLERPGTLAGREFLSDAEVTERNHNARIGGDQPPRPGNPGTYNAFWWDRGTSDGRTALIVDPPDGRLPALTPEAEQRAAARAEARRARGPADSWEDRSLAERCIHYRPLPRLPTGYNNHHQIFQTPGYVVILTEMIHNVRIIPLDGRPHIGAGISQWNGDSRGHWEGDTLVVETTNFSDKEIFRGSGANRHLIERFTRVDADTIEWEFTVEDPTTWTKPWTGMLPFSKVEGPIYEYACHEGNYGMESILAGHRADEKAAEEAAKQGSR